jgi:glutathione S-transferase
MPALSLRHRSAYVCGAEFTLVDVAVATYLAWTPYWTKADPEWKLAARWPRLAEYVARVMARPAVGPNVPLAWLDDTAAWLL